MAAGTVTITEERLGNIRKITFAWTAGTAGESGTASGSTTYPYTGNVLKVVTVPGTAGTQPSDDYDITITDEDAVDVANGQLLNRDDTLTEWVVSSLGAVVGDRLTINVTNAGSGKTGVCVAYVGVTPIQDQDTAVEDALYGGAGMAAWPNAADPANNVSLAEVIRALWGGLWGTAAGENGITTYPAAAAAGNNVSIAEVLRYIQATQIGTLTNSGGTATLGGILGDVANSSIAARLTDIMAEIEEVEGHFHTRARWFGKLAVQTATDWADNTLTPFRAISGANAYGADPNDEAQVFGTDDAMLAGQTKFDLDKILIVASSATTIYKLRFVYGAGTMADAIAAGQYTETMAVVASASSRIGKEDIRLPRLTVGTHQVWCQAWNAADNATIDFFVGIHGYAS